jgi:hypothetical protein
MNRENTGEYEIELRLAGRPVFLIAKISDVVTKGKGDTVEWSRAYVALTNEDVVLWESIVKPEDLDTFRLSGDEQLFHAIQELAEREAVPS